MLSGFGRVSLDAQKFTDGWCIRKMLSLGWIAEEEKYLSDVTQDMAVVEEGIITHSVGCGHLISGSGSSWKIYRVQRLLKDLVGLFIPGPLKK